MKYLFSFILFSLSLATYSQEPGKVIENTNEALPSSYNFKEYQFADPFDQGSCIGNSNSTAELEGVFFSQTHRHEITHPFFFIIGHRPALLQLAISGEGMAPDVKVEGFHGSEPLGELCLKGPDNLSSNIDLRIPSFEDYFTVTLPKSWITQDLSLEISIGNEKFHTLSPEQLKVGPYTELNLVEVKMDFMDYNFDPHRTPIFETFLEELASAIPVSVVRYGVFPEVIKYPEIVANNDTEQLARLKSRSEMAANGVLSDGSINSIATLALANLQHATGDFLSTVYFGNTLNLDPGGWGGGNSFVSFDFTDIFIHELGHALSLPHWGEGSYNNPNPGEYDFNYPYGGEGNNGGGRGENWNFNQHAYEFVDPLCRNEAQAPDGTERSDCMQRNNACLESRNSGLGPWDGFGDFSAYAMHRYFIGDENVETGTVEYKGEQVPFQFRMTQGFPILTLENGKRNYTRLVPTNEEQLHAEEVIDFPTEEQLNAPAYLIYGSLHETQDQANIMYPPIKFEGTIPSIIDPTDPEIFETLKEEQFSRLGEKDITIKVTYVDGSVLHALNPWHSFARSPYEWGYHIWRNDVVNFSLVVPGDKVIMKVEAYIRPFVTFSPGATHIGNINDPEQNITAENFMDAAIWKSEWMKGQVKTPGLGSIGNRVWHDLNQNGVDDPGEPGIEGVKLLMWTDSDGDGVPDSEGFAGSTETNENGNYNFSGLNPGKYIVFVWWVDNYDEGGPLHGMVPAASFTDPNTDIDMDDNGHPGGFPGLDILDVASGIVELTETGEPLNDGDREDDWFDYDVSGNQTIDFGFYFEGSCQQSPVNIEAPEYLCIGSSGSIFISATNTEEMLSYLWEDGSTESFLQDIEAGIYKVTITNEAGCSGERVIELKESPPIEFMINAPDSLCAGELTTVDLIISSGIGPYSISGDIIEGPLGPGTYDFTIVDENGCAVDASFTIEEASSSACTSGISDEENIDLKIYPNPFSDLLRIENDETSPLEVEIYSTDGKIIRTIILKAGHARTEELSGLHKGIYLARIMSQDESVLTVRKLVKL